MGVFVRKTDTGLRLLWPLGWLVLTGVPERNIAESHPAGISRIARAIFASSFADSERVYDACVVGFIVARHRPVI